VAAGVVQQTCDSWRELTVLLVVVTHAVQTCDSCHEFLVLMVGVVLDKLH
jgi:hypothetical protein